MSSRARASSTRSTRSGAWCASRRSRRRRGAPNDRTSRMKAALLRYLPLVLLALAWEVVARTGLVSTLALPPLSAVAAAFVDLVKDGDLVVNGGAWLWRVGGGVRGGG